jgi:hypothetical protein
VAIHSQLASTNRKADQLRRALSTEGDDGGPILLENLRTTHCHHTVSFSFCEKPSANVDRPLNAGLSRPLVSPGESVMIHVEIQRLSTAPDGRSFNFKIKRASAAR